MPFRQPNSLARALHQVMNDLLAGQTVELRFGAETELRYMLDSLREVTAVHRVAVQVQTTGRQSVAVSLVRDAA